MSVGTFPGMSDYRRRTIRGPINPMDKSTIVSIYPRAIHEVKHTISPGIFNIKPGSEEKPSILVVGPSSWWREIDEEQPLLEIPNSSIQVADSVVKDYCNGLLACNMHDTMPGLFYVPGAFNLIELRKQHFALFEQYAIYQRNWYSALVKMADQLWANTNGNPLVVSEDMRLAARELSLNDKDWMKDFESFRQVRCAACGSLKNPAFPVCGSCRAIDMSHPGAKDIKFAAN